METVVEAMETVVATETEAQEVAEELDIADFLVLPHHVEMGLYRRHQAQARLAGAGPELPYSTMSLSDRDLQNERAVTDYYAARARFLSGR